jgi:predicted acetyltransferase
MVSLKQDMYLHKYWASLDGKIWVNSHKLISVDPLHRRKGAATKLLENILKDLKDKRSFLG